MLREGRSAPFLAGIIAPRLDRGAGRAVTRFGPAGSDYRGRGGAPSPPVSAGARRLLLKPRPASRIRPGRGERARRAARPAGGAQKRVNSILGQSVARSKYLISSIFHANFRFWCPVPNRPSEDLFGARRDHSAWDYPRRDPRAASVEAPSNRDLPPSRFPSPSAIDPSTRLRGPSFSTGCWKFASRFTVYRRRGPSRRTSSIPALHSSPIKRRAVVAPIESAPAISAVVTPGFTPTNKRIAP